MHLVLVALGSAALTAPLQAQDEAPIRYVANSLTFNSGAATIGNLDDFYGAENNHQRTQQFTTGSREGGYRLSGIRFYLRGNVAANNGKYSVRLFRGANQDRQQGEVASFGNHRLPNAPTRTAWHELAPESETVLLPNTDYHVWFRLRPAAQATVSLGTAGGVETGRDGWRIASGSYAREGQNGHSSWEYREGEKISLEIFAAPALSDAEIAPVIGVRVDPGSIPENGGLATVTATADPAPRSDIALQVAVTPGPGTTAADYTVSANKVLTIAAGATTSTGTVTVTPVNDGIGTFDRTLAITVTSDAEVDVSRAAASLTIEEDDAVPPPPTGVTAREAPDFVLLEWRPGARTDAEDLSFQYRMRVGGGAYGAWTDIPDSGPGDANSTGYKVTGLARDTRYGFGLRARDGDRYSEAVEVSAETFTPFTAILKSSLGFFWDDSLADGRVLNIVEAEFSHDFHERNRRVFDNHRSPHVEYVNARRRAAGFSPSNPRRYTFQALPLQGATTYAITLKAPAEPYRCTLAEAERALKICSADLRPLSEDARIVLGGVRTVRLSLDTASIAENGGVANVTASLHTLNTSQQDDRTGIRVHVDVAVESISAATEADYTLANSDAALKPNRLVIEPGASVSRNRIVIAAVDNDVLERDKRLRISASTDATHVLLQHLSRDAPEDDPVLTIEEDETGFGPPAAFRLLPALNAFVLSWDASPNDAREHTYEYRYKAGEGEYGEWTAIPDSGRGEANHEGYTLTGLVENTRHDFRLRAVDAGNNATEATGAAEATLRPFTAEFDKFNLPDRVEPGAEFQFKIRFDRPARGPAMFAPGQEQIVVEGGAHTRSVHEYSPKTHPNHQIWILTVLPDRDATEVVVRLAPGTPPHTRCTDGDNSRICSAENDPLTHGATHRFPVARSPPVQVSSVSLATGPGGNGVWDAGETVAVEVAFSGAVTVEGPAGSPTLAVLLDGARRAAAYVSGSGTDTLRFAWTVTGEDAGARRARLVANGIATGEATIVDSAGRAAALDYAVAPYVTGVSFAPVPSGDGYWSKGETLAVRLSFSEAVSVLDGSPAVEVAVGSRKGAVEYASGSGTDTLVFSRAFAGGRWRAEIIALVADSLRLEGARIVGRESGLAAEPGHPGARADGEEPQALTAAFAALPAGHGGVAFTFELAFSEAFTGSYRTLRDSAFEVQGGRVTHARRAHTNAQERDRVWRITVAPDAGADEVTVALSAATDCAAAGAVCTVDDRPLSAAVSASVPRGAPAPAPGTPLTAHFERMPAEHAGEAFGFEARFSEAFRVSWLTMRDRAFAVAGGRVTGARRGDNPHHEADGMEPNRVWRITVEPDGMDDVTVELPVTVDCAATGAVCTESGEALSNAVSATIPGPPGLSVADARVEEGPDVTLDFAVTLGRASTATVTVDYATSDGTATTGEDYTRTTGTLTFAPGETAKTVPVPVLDDAHDEGEETLTLTLSNPSGGNAWLEDAEATGTIVNTDAMPQAWLARFGRTVAEQVIEAVEGRFSANRTAGVEMTLAGERIGLSGSAPEGPGSGSGAGADARSTAAEEAEARSRLATMTQWLRGTEENADEGRRAGYRSRAVTPRDLLTGSSFALTGEAKAGGAVSLWGRGAVSRFDGREGDLTLDGEVVSAMFGADWAADPGSGSPGSKSGAGGAGRWTAGLLVSRSVGEGGYRGPDMAGTVASTMTGLFPYGRYATSDRVTLWGIAGYGAGEFTLRPEKAGDAQDSPATMRVDMDLAMGAVGLRGIAVEAPADGGVELAVKTDAMAVRTCSEKTRGLEAAEADVTRLRLALEGNWRGLTAGAGTLVPTAEVGLRHDGGDAETGFGLDLGGGLAWSDPEHGVSAELRGRGLLTHESAGFRDRGLSGSFAWAPGREGRGPSLTLTQTMGASSAGGADALLGRRHLGGLAANDPGSGSGAGGSGADDLANRRLELRMGYGFSVLGDRFTMAPEAALGLSNGRREYTLGWRLGSVGGGPVSMELGLEATRSETAGGSGRGGDAQHAVGFRATARW